MLIAALRLGKMLFFDHYPKFYLDLLGWVFCIGIVTFVIVSVLRSKRSTVTKPTATPSPMGSIPTHLLQGKAGRIGKTVGLLMLGVFLGWNARAIRQFNHTYVLNDVRVLRRDGPDKYLMQTAWGQAFEMKFCSDYLPQLPDHVILKNLVYEDRESCKSVADKQLGYLLKRDENGTLVKFTEGE